MRRIGPCMCGAIDCPSCGPAQGYTVKRRWNPKTGRLEYYNPEEGEEDDEDEEPEYNEDRDER